MSTVPEDTALYLGLISGTSADAIDAVLVRFGTPGSPRAAAVQAHLVLPYPHSVRTQVLAFGQQAVAVDLDALAALDVAVGQVFADAANALLAQAGVEKAQVRAIGSHGQTLRHGPAGPTPFTLQIGDPHVIAERTGIDVVADFRRRDVAAGGQGAPLVPAFHAALFGRASTTAVLNLGGIANVTLLVPGQPVRGWDTGPANALLDACTQAYFGLACDRDAQFAQRGQVLPALLATLKSERYFARLPPKSTGRDLFHLPWLERHAPAEADPHDLLATLVELSAQTVADALQPHAPTRVLVCGGGVHNPLLQQRLAALLAPAAVTSTASVGVDPDLVEALAFAWLAREFLAGRPGNRAEVTGAAGPRRLGALFPAR